MKGSCNCGAIKFSVEGNSPNLYQCHCSLCRKQGGSVSNTATIVPKEKFKWISGKKLITKWQKPTVFTAHFCKVCGSPVPNSLQDIEFMWIPVGLIHDEESKIVAHLCCSSKASWDNIPSDITNYKNMPNDLVEFIQSLSKKPP